MTISININASADYIKKILFILENAQSRQTFDKQSRDLYLLAKVSLGISTIVREPINLLNILETLKTKIIVSQDPSDEQYECLNQGLKCFSIGYVISNKNEIKNKANECLDLLLKSCLIPPDFFLR